MIFILLLINIIKSGEVACPSEDDVDNYKVGCQTCTQEEASGPIACIGCVKGYKFSSGTCTGCGNNEVSAGGETAECTICTSSQVPSADKSECISCNTITGCSTCTANSEASEGITCTGCEKGYKFSSGTCTGCGNNEVSAGGETAECTICTGSQVPSADKSECISCNTITGCSTCTANSEASEGITCTGCEKGYKFSSGTCTGCGNNEVSAGGETAECTICTGSQVPSADKSECISCNTITGCSTCTANSEASEGITCTGCEKGYKFSSGTCTGCGNNEVSAGGETAECTICTGSQVPSADKSECISCNTITGCSTCTANSEASEGITCTGCEKGYKFSSGTCTGCGNNEVSAGGETAECTTCTGSQVPSADKSECIDSYVCEAHASDPDIATTCCKLTDNCAMCSIETKEECILCKDTFTLTIIKQCKLDTSVTCLDLISNCQTCVKDQNLDTKECQICEENYGITNAGKCEECSNTQAVHPTTHKCVTKCTTGSGESVCQTCSDENPSVCGSCNGDFEPNTQGQCVPPSSNECKIGEGPTDCKTCDETEKTKCATCNTNSGLTDDGGCAQCSNTQAVHPTTHKCVTKCTTGSGDSECKTCSNDDPSKCGLCNGNSQVNSDGQCVPPTQPSECIPKDSNCLTCQVSDKCTKCKSNYGLDKTAGTCTKCGDGESSNGEGPCTAASGDCLSIENCILCNETVKTKCAKCNTSYELDEDGNCILELAKCDQSAIDRGCTVCYFYDKTVCAQCNEEQGFKKVPNKETKQCECENPDYNISGGICTLLTVQCQWGDSEPIIGCTACHSRRPSECLECNAQNGFEYDIQTKKCKCKYEGYVIDGQTCIPPKTSGCNEADQLVGCIKCIANDPSKCETCDESKGLKVDNGACVCEYDGYELNDKGICALPLDSGCNSSTIVPGCIKCKTDPNICTACNPELGFVSTASSGKCDCKTGFTLRLDGTCSNDKIESIDPPNEELEEKTLKEGCSDCITESGEEGSKTININTSDMKNNDIKLYITDIGTDVNTVNVEGNRFENVLLKVASRGEDKPLNVKIEKGQEIRLDTTGSTLPINLPKDSDNVDFDCNGGTSELTIGSTDNQVNIGNFVLTNGATLTLKPVKDLNLNVLDLFSSETVDIQKPTGSEAKVKVTTVKVEQGYTPTIKNLEITKDLNIAPSGQLKLDDTVTFSNANFNIYRNISQAEDNTYFELLKKINHAPKRILIKNRQRDIFLDDKNDKVILIHAPESKFDNDTCVAWAEKVSNDGDYRGAECIKKDPKNNNDNSVYAYKAINKPKDKDKLSAGAIAGIVIACVVVVAAIIALLVYFLVIKKKNQSTTSTQGDSSIAI